MRTLIATLAFLATAASADTFVVSRSDDGAGPGTLRWAIEQVNATPATQTTHSTISVATPMTIAPERELPAVTQPAELKLTKLLLDGTRTPAASGLTIAADDVSVTGLTVSNFAIAGIVLAGKNDALRYCESSSNGTGIVIHGIFASVYDSVIRANRGHGIHVAADAGGTTLGGVHDVCPFECMPAPGPNTISSNGGDGIHVDGDFTYIRGSLIDHNSGDGIAAAAATTIVECDTSFNAGNGITARVPLRELTNTIGACNGRLFLDERGDGPTLNDPGDLDDVTNAPHLDSAVDDLTVVTVAGTLDAKPNTSYRLDFEALAPACDDGPYVVGSMYVATDSHGFAGFRRPFYKADALFGKHVASVAAMAWPVSGYPPTTFTHSELSAPVNAVENRDHRVDLAVSVSAPPTAQPGQRITVEIQVTNRGPAAIEFALTVRHVPGAIYDAGGLGFYSIGPLAPGQSATVYDAVTLPAASGPFSIQAEVAPWSSAKETETDPSDNVAVATVNVAPVPPRRRTAR